MHRAHKFTRSLSLCALMLVLIVFAACATAPSTSPDDSGPKWTLLSAALTERTEVAAAVAGGKIYLIGGYVGQGESSASVEIYDPVGDSFSRAPDLPVEVNHSMAAGLNDSVYVFGGYAADGAPIDRAFVLEAARWRELPPMPEARGAAGVALAEGKFFVAGGVGPSGLAENVLVFDPSANDWSAMPGPPTKREHLGVASLGSKIYVVGGRTEEGNLGVAEVLDVATRSWSRLPDLPTPRGGIAAAATANGFVVVPGGEAEATFEEVEAFDVEKQEWRSLNPLPTARHGLGVAAIGNKIYVIQGGPTPGFSFSKANEMIDLGSLR